MTDNQILKSHITACDRHIEMIEFCYQSIEKYFPFTANKIESLTKLEITQVDDFLNRLAKFQDTVGAKIFFYLLKILGEDVDKLSYIDRLNRLEKLEILPSADLWQEMRKVRNYMVDEYPDNLDTIVMNLNKAQEMMSYMTSYWLFLKPKLQTYLD